MIIQNGGFFCIIKSIYIYWPKRILFNGIFGFKFHYNQFEDEFGADRLEECFDNLKFIFITREDKILQGISLEKAFQTQKWSSEFSSLKRAKFNYLSIKKKSF